MGPSAAGSPPGELQIAWTSGLTEPLPDGLDAYMGISFSKTRYFSRPVMARYVEWACARFRAFLLIVADHLEIHNLRVFRHLSLDEASAHATQTGHQLRHAYEHAVPEALRPQVTIRLASEILAEPACAGALASLGRVAEREPRFRDGLRAAVVGSLAGKLRAARLKGAPREAALDVLQNYILEELAIIVYVTHLAPRRFDVSIFPYRPQQVILDMHAGPYAQLFVELTGGRPFRAIELVPPELARRERGADAGLRRGRAAGGGTASSGGSGDP